MCLPSGAQTIIAHKQRPVCKQVTRPTACESKWVINDLGEKVWDGNENCQQELAEECSVETYSEPISVPTVSCQDGETINYQEPVLGSEEVTIYSLHCNAGAVSPVCTTTTKQECLDVAEAECSEQLVPKCGGLTEEGIGGQLQTFQIPYQTFDHRLKCLV